MTEIKKELEAIHSIKSKGVGDEEEFVLGQHYPPGVIGMKELVKCWEYHLKENKRLQKEADGMNKPLCDKIDELIYDNDILKEEIKELKENLGYSEDNVKELTHERYERYGLEGSTHDSHFS